MPLIRGKSKKSFSKNVATEMNAGKPQPQALAIAYGIKRQSGKKKMADGGKITADTMTPEEVAMVKGHRYAKGGEVSASDEKRPMPDSTYNDSAMASRNSGNKAPKQDSWTDNPTVSQAQKPSITRLSQPKIIGSDAFSVRSMNMRDEENDMGDSLYPESDRAQPNKRDDEEGPNRQGPKVPDMAAQHNNDRAPYKQEKEDQYAQDEAEGSMKKIQSPLGRYAKGGMVMNPKLQQSRLAEGGPVMQPKDHGDELMERDDEADMGDMLAPGKHGEQPKSAYDELDADMEGDDLSDHEKPHSLAQAVMRKRYADGGMVDLEKNSEEDLNNEDQMSYDAGLKEQYDLSQLDEQPEDSNEHGHVLEDEDSHDMVGSIRKRMKSRL